MTPKAQHPEGPEATARARGVVIQCTHGNWYPHDTSQPGGACESCIATALSERPLERCALTTTGPETATGGDVQSAAGREPQYFGQPGHCFNIDGEWWHDPGTCKGAPDNCDAKCCGILAPEAARLAEILKQTEFAVRHIGAIYPAARDSTVLATTARLLREALDLVAAPPLAPEPGGAESFLDDVDAKFAELTPAQQQKALKICREVFAKYGLTPAPPVPPPARDDADPGRGEGQDDLTSITGALSWAVGQAFQSTDAYWQQRTADALDMWRAIRDEIRAASPSRRDAERKGH